MASRCDSSETRAGQPRPWRRRRVKGETAERGDVELGRRCASLPPLHQQSPRCPSSPKSLLSGVGCESEFPLSSADEEALQTKMEWFRQSLPELMVGPSPPPPPLMPGEERVCPSLPCAGMGPSALDEEEEEEEAELREEAIGGEGEARGDGEGALPWGNLTKAIEQAGFSFALSVASIVKSPRSMWPPPLLGTPPELEPSTDSCVFQGEGFFSLSPTVQSLQLGYSRLKLVGLGSSCTGDASS